MEHIAWMAWTLPTAIFFVMLSMTLAVMTWLAVAYPEAERVGILHIPTTRGDRLFISLIATAVIHLLWIGWVLWFGLIESGIHTMVEKPVTQTLAEADALISAAKARGVFQCSSFLQSGSTKKENRSEATISTPRRLPK